MKAILQAGRLLANLRWILRPSLLVFSLYWLSRIAFMVKYPQSVHGMPVSEIPRFIFLSFRFDSSLFFTLNLLPLLLLLLPGRPPLPTRISKVLFTLANGLFLSLNSIDLYFFAFNGRRTDWPTLRFLLSDSLHQLPQLLLNYAVVPLFSVLCFWAIWKSFPPAVKAERQEKYSILPLVISWVFLLAAGIGLIRNSLGQKPLLPGNAFVLQPHPAGHAALNTGFVLFKTLESTELEKADFLNEKEMLACLPKCEKQVPGQLKGRNLVLIILESFATEYTGLEAGAAGQTPFLDSLAHAGLFFPHHFACGRTSRDALPSILASVPPWMEESFAASPYVSVEMEGLGTSLSRAGYQTAFFHGGKNGTMAFDLMSRLCGFSRYYGMNEYPGNQDYDGNWGIFDQPFLQFTAGEMKELREPFAAGIFTLSSHQPYTLPRGWTDTVGTEGRPVFRAIRYADHALKAFFQTASRMPWYKNTLFVLTADHSHQVFSPAFQDYPGLYDVPLVLFAPGAEIRSDTGNYIQHSDIGPGILDLLGLKSRKQNRLSRGFSSCLPFPPMQFQDGNYHVIHPEGLLIWDGKESRSSWRWESKNGKPEPAGLRMQTMARLQYFRNGMLENSLFR